MSLTRKVLVSNEQLLVTVVEMLGQGQSVTIRAKGDSMLPFIIGERDLVVLERQSTYHKYDMVLCDLGCAHFVLHRIIKIEGMRVTLMGDGNIYGTESCLVGDIAGRAVRIIRQHRSGDRVIDRIINCTGGAHRFRAWVWATLRPMRRYLLAIYRRLFTRA